MTRKKQGTYDADQIKITCLSKVIGQRHVVDQLQLHVRAHFNIRASNQPGPPPLGPILMSGPPGTGKTMTAHVLHCELGNLHFVETNGVALNDRSELYRVLLRADEHTTVFIDEAQGLDARSQNVLLPAISEGKLHLPLTGSHVYDLKPFTLILATTHEFQLRAALRDRMKIVCQFKTYSTDELIQIVGQRVKALGWAYESDEVLRMVAERAKGTPRQALHRNLQTAWHVAMSHDRELITVEDVREAFDHLQLDELGLDERARVFLSILSQDGPTPLGVLASRLGLPAPTVQRVVEPFLIAEGLITKAQSSLRELTAKGRQHLQTTTCVSKEDK